MLKNTKLLHGYPVMDAQTGAASIPKYQAATFNQNDLFTSQAYTYTRLGNPTIHALEEAVASLYDAKYGLVFSSGTAAISNVLLLLGAGDHIIIPKEVYGGTCQFANDILPKYGIEVTFVDYGCLKSVRSAIKENTKMLYMETPSNPLLKVTDIRGVVALAKDHELLTVSDNTFMTALNQKPLEYNVDIIVESATKFLNGHSDVLAGIIVTNHSDRAETLRNYQKLFGNVLGIEEAWLVLRGMKTMGIRLEKSVTNATAIATYLSTHEKVKQVYYPGLPTHPNHHIQLSQGENGGSVLSFELIDEKAVATFTQAIKLPLTAISLGGVESIISYPWTMSHAGITEAERLDQGVTAGLLRYSCGIEDAEDLMADLEQALQMI